jgi:hypothetical protein
MTRFSWMLFFVCSVTWANAGIIKENGGNTIICSGAGASGPELLDFYEARNYLPPDEMHFEHWQEMSKAEILENVLTVIDEVRAPDPNPYRQWIAEFEAEANFVPNTLLGVVADSFHIVVPPNCNVEQTVIQIAPIFHEARYTISDDIWQKMKPLQQAGLQIHELVYRELNSSDSRMVRLITGLLFSDELHALNPEGRKELLLKAGFSAGASFRNKGRYPSSVFPLP